MKTTAEDCAYLHTKNPNADNFPIKVMADNKSAIENEDLKEFVDSLHMEGASKQQEGYASCGRHVVYKAWFY